MQLFIHTLLDPPEQVARLELAADGLVVDSIEPGTNPPTVSILSPAGGETLAAAIDVWARAMPVANPIAHGGVASSTIASQ